MADLETPDPVPEAHAETPPTEAPPDPTTAEPEGTVEVEGDKKVPLSALVAERREKQALKQKAEQFDQMVGYVQSVKPYIEFLQNNPGLISQTQQTAAPTQTTTTQVDEKAETLARTLDLYTADGKPDVKRAQVMLKLVDDTAEAKAAERVKPVQERTLQSEANYQKSRAGVTVSPEGYAPDPMIFENVWNRSPLDQKSTEEGALAIWGMALGLSMANGSARRGAMSAQRQAPQQTQQLQAPVYTETPGSRTPTKPSLTGLEQKIAELRGLNDKTYHERTKGFTPGRTNALED